jgi:hypothetical protein
MQKSGKEISEDLIQLLKVSPEKNAIIDKFNSFGIDSKVPLIRNHSTQNEYCNKSKCLECR